MSGGVDSSVSALLLKKQGFYVTGITLRLYEDNSRCCNLKDIYDAQAVAKKIGIPHYLFDVRDLFKKEIVEYFVHSYLSGKTPNPCPLCNNTIKFKMLLSKAKEMGIDFIASGHYAKIVDTNNGKRLTLSKDDKKSQEYFLALLSDEIINHLILPLGDYTKTEVRNIAKEEGLSTSEKKDSQEICFIPDGNYFNFIKKYTDLKLQKGEIVTKEGKTVGYHEGYYKYTIGQRRGIGIGMGKPQYVIEIDPIQNKIFIGNKIDIMQKQIKVKLLKIFDPYQQNLVYKIKIRYKSVFQDCKIINEKKDILTIEATDLFFAPTPGQLAVFYDEILSIVFAGEIIK